MHPGSFTRAAPACPRASQTQNTAPSGSDNTAMRPTSITSKGPSTTAAPTPPAPRAPTPPVDGPCQAGRRQTPRPRGRLRGALDGDVVVPVAGLVILLDHRRHIV